MEGQILSMTPADKLEKNFQQINVGQHAILHIAIPLNLKMLTLQSSFEVMNSMWTVPLTLLIGTMILVMGMILAFVTGEMDKLRITPNLPAMSLFLMGFCVLRQIKNQD